jgi:Zn-dependent protease/CBS domain-containing protein
MGLVAALGLFGSILLHEVSHAVVARRFGLETRCITLWIFGGVAETAAEPGTPQAELRVALAGPACSFALAAALGALGYAGTALGVPLPIAGVLLYLGWINLVLAVFNLLPGFPLDGGRVLRAILWRATGDVHRATRAASRTGVGLGVLMMAAGILFAFGGNLLGGLWWVLIGSFLRRAAESSFQQVAIRRVLEGVPVFRMMDHDPPTVPLGLSLDRFVHDYAYARGHMRFPVLRDTTIVGFVDASDVRAIPSRDWPYRTVDALVRPLSAEVVIGPEVDGSEALRRLQEGPSGTLLVVDGDRLEGVLTLDDVLRALRVRTLIEGQPRPLRPTRSPG